MSTYIKQFIYDQNNYSATSNPLLTTLIASNKAVKNYVPYNSSYQDVVINLPSGSTTKIRDNNNTYYLKLTVPRDPVFNFNLNLKLCAGTGTHPEKVTSDDINFNNFQWIKQISVPKDDAVTDVTTEAALFEYNKAIKCREIKTYKSSLTNLSAGLVYKNNNEYKYCIKYYPPSDEQGGTTTLPQWTDTAYFRPITNYEIYDLLQSWNYTSENLTSSTIEYNFIFSPQYSFNSSDATYYKYLWLEIVRNEDDNQIKYIDKTDNKTYNGKRLDINNLKFELYRVNNLFSFPSSNPTINLNGGKVSHISISGAPGAKFAVNGEEIILGSNGIYELKDFNVTSFGSIKENDNKVFLLNYEYTN